MKRLVFVLVGLLGLAYAQQRDSIADRVIPYTLSDRDRGVRIEAKLDSFIEETNRRFEDQRALSYTVLAAILATCLGLVSVIIWDRRTTVSATAKETSTLLRKELDDALARIHALESKIADLQERQK